MTDVERLSELLTDAEVLIEQDTVVDTECDLVNDALSDFDSETVLLADVVTLAVGVVVAVGLRLGLCVEVCESEVETLVEVLAVKESETVCEAEREFERLDDTDCDSEVVRDNESVLECDSDGLDGLSDTDCEKLLDSLSEREGSLDKVSDCEVEGVNVIVFDSDSE